MKHRIWPVFMLFCACGGATVGQEPPAPTPPPNDGARPVEQPAVAPSTTPRPEAAAATSSPPVPDKPSPLQVVGNQLFAAGWSCWPRSVELPTLDCPADATHPTAMRVVYSSTSTECTKDDPCILRLTSYDAPRVFGTPCEKLGDALDDLTNAAHQFSVVCNDTTTDPMTSQQFGFTTSLKVTDASKPGIVAALPMHRADREAALKKLASIKALDRSKATAPKEKHDVAKPAH